MGSTESREELDGVASGWSDHPIMKTFGQQRTAQKAAHDEYSRLCSSATEGRSGELALTLPADILDRILREAIDPQARRLAEEGSIPPAKASERYARQTAIAEARRTLTRAARVCKVWKRAADKRIARDLNPAMVTSRQQIEKVVSHIDKQTIGRMRRQKTFELNLPSPLWTGVAPPCLCDGMDADECMPLHGHDWTTDLADDHIAADARRQDLKSRATWQKWNDGDDVEACDLANHDRSCMEHAIRHGLHPTAESIEMVLQACQFVTHVTLTNMLAHTWKCHHPLLSGLAALSSVTHFHCETYDVVTGYDINQLFLAWRALEEIRVVSLPDHMDSSGAVGQTAWSVHGLHKDDDDDDEDDKDDDDDGASGKGSAVIVPGPVVKSSTLAAAQSDTTPSPELGGPCMYAPDHLDTVDLVLSREGDAHSSGFLSSLGSGPVLDVRIAWIRDKDELSESTSATVPQLCRGILQWNGHAFDRITNLTLDLPCKPRAVHECLSRCENLEVLTIGPSPPISEALFNSFPPSLDYVTLVFEAAENVMDPREASQILIRSTALQDVSFLLDIQMASDKPGSQLEDQRNGWTKEEQTAFKNAVEFTMADVIDVVWSN